MNYYLLTFSFLYSGKKAKRGVEPRKFGEKWGTESVNTRFSLPTLLYTEYNEPDVNLKIYILTWLLINNFIHKHFLENNPRCNKTNNKLTYLLPIYTKILSKWSRLNKWWGGAERDINYVPGYGTGPLYFSRVGKSILGINLAALLDTTGL